MRTSSRITPFTIAMPAMVSATLPSMVSAMLPAMLPATLLAVTLAVSGCSFSFGDDEGPSDITIAGRSPGQLVGGAEGVEGAKSASDDDRGLRKIAILPVAYRDAAGGYACDLCGDAVQMQETGAAAARLATGFLYEAVARHPRILFPNHQSVEKVASRGMRQAAADLAAGGSADAVIVAALVELRPRVGPDDSPEKPAGVTMFLSLVDARSGTALWSKTFDREEAPPSWFRLLLHKIWGDTPRRWSTAEGYTEVAADNLVEDLIDYLD